MQDAAHGVPPHRHQFEAESLSLLGGEEQIGEEPQPPRLFMENPRAAASWTVTSEGGGLARLLGVGSTPIRRRRRRRSCRPGGRRREICLAEEREGEAAG